MKRIKDKNLRCHIFGTLVENDTLDLGIDEHLEMVMHIMGEDYDYEEEGWEELEKCRNFIDNYTLSDAELSSLDSLCLDGGNEGPMIVWPHWGEVTEDYEEFDVACFEGIEIFPKLKNIDFIGCYSSDVNLSGLLKLKSLESIEIAPESKEYLELLAKNGVDIEGYYYNPVSVDMNDVDALISEANNLYDYSEYDRALTLFEKALDLEDALSYQQVKNYIKILKNKKKKEKLVSILTKLVAASPNDDRLYLAYIKAVKKVTDNEKLKLYYKKLLDISPENRMIKHLLLYAKYLKKIEDYEGSEKQLLKALALDPDNEFANFEYAYLLTYKLERDYDKAKDAYLKALSGDPQDRDYNYDFAILLEYELDDIKTAAKHYKIALKDEREYFIRMKNYARFLDVSLNDPKKSLKMYEKIKECFDFDLDYEDSREYFIFYADLLVQIKKYKKALKLYKKVLPYDSYNEELQDKIISLNHVYLSNFDEAREMCEARYTANKKDEDINFSYLQILEKVDPQNPEIDKIFKFLLKKEYTNEDFTNLHIQKIQMASKDADDFYKSIYKCVIKYGDEGYLCTHAILMSGQKKKHDDAIKMLSDYLNIIENSHNVLGALGVIYHQGKQDLKKAVEYYEKALALEFDMPILHNYYPAALEQLGEHEKQAKFLKKLSKLDG